MRYIEKDLSHSLVMEAQFLLNKSRHYNQNYRVKEIIRILYAECCTFCESYPEATSFYQIEHFYPKGNRLYSKYSKKLENLHYSCQRCNVLKGKGVHHKLFSPNFYLNGKDWQVTDPKKIEDELFYIGHLLFSKNRKAGSIDRAQYTIDLFNLNNLKKSARSSRQHLIESRLRVFQMGYMMIHSIYSLLDDYHASSNHAIDTLFLMLTKLLRRDSSYSTMLIHNFGEDIVKLLEVYLRMKKPNPSPHP